MPVAPDGNAVSFQWFKKKYEWWKRGVTSIEVWDFRRNAPLHMREKKLIYIYIYLKY